MSCRCRQPLSRGVIGDESRKRRRVVRVDTIDFTWSSFLSSQVVSYRGEGSPGQALAPIENRGRRLLFGAANSQRKSRG